MQEDIHEPAGLFARSHNLTDGETQDREVIRPPGFEGTVLDPGAEEPEGLSLDSSSGSSKKKKPLAVYAALRRVMSSIERAHKSSDVLVDGLGVGFHDVHGKDTRAPEP